MRSRVFPPRVRRRAMPPALALLAAGALCAPAGSQQEAHPSAGAAGGPPSRARPAEVYVPPALPFRGPLPDVALELLGACRLPGEPLAGPVWAGERGVLVATEDPESGEHRLVLCPETAARPAWSVPLEEAPAGSPAVDGARAYVLLASGEAQARDVATGAVVWRASVGGEAAGGLAVMDGELVGASGAALFVLDAASGKVRIQVPLGAPPVLPPAACGDRIWVVALASGAALALDPATGARRWERALQGVPASPACDGDGRVLVGTSARDLVSLSLRRGGRAWRQRLGGAVAVPPVSLDGGVYAGGLDGRIYGFKRDSGHRLWSVGVGERVRRAPAVVGSLLAVASAGETRLSLLHLPTGRILLEAEAPPEAAGWVGSPAARTDRLALAADRRSTPDGVLLVYRVAERIPSGGEGP